MTGVGALATIPRPSRPEERSRWSSTGSFSSRWATPSGSGAAARQQTAGDKDTGQVKLKNPFSLGPALKFSAFFVVILSVAKVATLHFGDRGLYAAAALSGLADVDAITLSIAGQTRGGSLAHAVGAVGVTIAVVTHSIVKIGIALQTGGWRFGRTVAMGLGLATVAGLAVALLL